MAFSYSRSSATVPDPDSNTPEVAVMKNSQAIDNLHTALNAGNLGSGDLVSTNNLSDLDDADTALDNLDFSVFGKSVATTSNAGTCRTLLGLGSLSTESTINNDDWSGTVLSIGNGGTGASLASNARANLGLEIGVDVQGYDVDTLKADTPDELTAGFSNATYNAGTQSSGTFTPDQDNGNFQRVVNGGAHTIAPPTDDTSLVIQYTNNASAGTITTSGFTIVDGDDLTTTDGDDFIFYITKINGFSHLTVKAMQ